MDRVLLDSSALFDITRALQGQTAIWAISTLGNLANYEQSYSKLTISGIPVFELLEGLYRTNNAKAISDFQIYLLPTYEVIQPDFQIEHKAAEIHAKLRQARLSIDSFRHIYSRDGDCSRLNSRQCKYQTFLTC